MCFARQGAKMARHVLLTGPPGIGKTTLIHKTIDVLKSSGVPVDGFYTEEVRKDRRRIGFDVVTVSGKRGTLSRTSDSGSLNHRCAYRVGQYAVDLPSFECLVLPLLRKVSDRNDTEKKVYVIDEIGKMELFSEPFIQSVRQILDGPGGTILGTIPIPKGKPLELVEEIRSRKDVKIFNITKDNRNNIVQEIVASVQDCRELNRN
ncbi:cancer-related nucleoside-triphosphatase isoform X2 [Rhincodon typus]|uniref:cancer-related nucleoside-triphosphatase isoform X2 n=1 Tax=Rhincodon typus TaxID=259920 RepID=UPI00202F52C9|nr:cancer-related nucleoside-triphosphatase isoform X2 [Rhincodon typus]